MSKTIFTVTAVYLPTDQLKKKYGPRTFGYFFTFREVEQYLETDLAHIQECLYNYVVVEEFRPGIHAFCEIEDQRWFVYNTNDKWEPCENPIKNRNTFNYGMG